MTFGGAFSDEEDARAMYRVSRDAGVNFFDCANGYTRGRAEELLGELIEGHRDEVVITTKVGSKLGPGPNDTGLSRRHMLASLEQSLRRLRTDYVDLFFLHRPDPATPIEEALRTLDDIVTSGKARFVACSNFPAWEVARAMEVSDRRGYTGYHVLQPRYNLLSRDAEQDLFPLAQHYDLGVMVYSPLAGGLLSGKYGKNVDSVEGKARLKDFKVYRDRWGGKSDLELAEQFSAIAAEAGVAPATLAVAWTARHPAVSTPIVGGSRPEQLEAAFAAADFKIDDALYDRINSLVDPASDS